MSTVSERDQDEVCAGMSTVQVDNLQFSDSHTPWVIT